jgi:IS5 family transposase
MLGLQPGAAGHNLRLLVAWLTMLLRALFIALLLPMQPELAAA